MVTVLLLLLWLPASTMTATGKSKSTAAVAVRIPSGLAGTWSGNVSYSPMGPRSKQLPGGGASFLEISTPGVDGENDLEGCKRFVNEQGGNILMVCPRNTLTIIEARGFREDIDPASRQKTAGDFTQDGHKAPAVKGKWTYTATTGGDIKGPTGGNCDDFPRHSNCTNISEIAFAVFKSEKANDQTIYNTCRRGLKDLCHRLATTNPPSTTSWRNDAIMWTCGTTIELSVSNMFHHHADIIATAEAYQQATTPPMGTGTFHENRYKMGQTPTQGVVHLTSGGIGKAHARAILKTIAAHECAYLLAKTHAAKTWLTRDIRFDRQGVRREGCSKC